MAEKFVYIAILIVLLIIGYGAVIYIESETQKNLITHATNALDKLFNRKSPNLRSYKPIKKERVIRLYKERIWVKGKSFDECTRYSKVLNNNTIKCRSGYYKEIDVWK